MLALKYCAAIISLSFAVQYADGSSRDPDDNVLPPMGHTKFCIDYPRECEPSGNDRAFVFTNERKVELEQVNHGVNSAITPVAQPPDDRDRWLIGPLNGDCNDYAVTKRHDLLQKGWSSDQLLLAEVVVASGEHHLILIAKTPKATFVLDNLRADVPQLFAVRNDYQWVRIETPDNPKYWTKSFGVLT